MDRAGAMIEALGGPDNLKSIEACATRVRTVLGDAARLDANAVRRAGGLGILTTGDTTQIIVGAAAAELAAAISERIARPPAVQTVDAGPAHTPMNEPGGEPSAASPAAKMLVALGGPENVKDVDACATRVRATVADPEEVDQPALKAAGALGVLSAGKSVQIVVGTRSDAVAAEIQRLIS